MFTNDVGSEIWCSDEFCSIHFAAISKSEEVLNIRQEKNGLPWDPD